MAHFAKLGKGNIVEKVVVVSNDVATTEQAGIDFLKELYNEPNAVWVQTSFNGTFRKNFAGKGHYYDAVRDGFVELPRPYNSWQLNEETCKWEAPVAHPTDGKPYRWNEDTKSWIEITNDV